MQGRSPTFVYGCKSGQFLQHPCNSVQSSTVSQLLSLTTFTHGTNDMRISLEKIVEARDGEPASVQRLAEAAGNPTASSEPQILLSLASMPRSYITWHKSQ